MATISAVAPSSAEIYPTEIRAAVMLSLFGIETRGRRLEEISVPATDQRLADQPA